MPTAPLTTGIGWCLASAGYAGIQLPIAESTTGINSGWGPTASNLANEFEVTGNVATPEPGSIILCAAGLLAVLAAKRSRDARIA